MKEILFANGEPAAIVRAGSKRYLVVGDLHIGRELKLAGKGIRIYGTSDLMADRIITLMKRNKTKRLVLLGDVKDSIIRPDSVEMRIIQSFFRKLSSYEITLVQGNHDAGLGDIPNVAVTKEFIAGNIGMIHGNSLPSDELMRCDYIIAGHDHPAVTVGHDYDAHLEKTWVVMSISARNASKTYEMPNRKAKLVIMPAFNDLITGSDVAGDRIINPLVRRGIFKKSGARLFSLTGQPFALPD